MLRQYVQFSLRFSVVCVLGASFLNCRGGELRGSPPDSSKPTQLPKSDRIPGAERRLAEYLDASLVNDKDQPIQFDTIMSCVPENESEPTFGLADYKILGSRQRGDTVEASAVVVTVAEESGDPAVPNRRVATQRIKTDTLHWTMTKDSVTHRWGVCGISREGYDFGLSTSRENTTWRPRGTSFETVRALADSIRRK